MRKEDNIQGTGRAVGLVLEEGNLFTVTKMLGRKISKESKFNKVD